MSRVVSGLAARGVVARDDDARDARAVRLSLTAKGRKLYKGLIRTATERDAVFLGELNAAERKALDAALSKLASRAREDIQSEKATS